MTENDETLLQQFFSEARQVEIPGAEFSEKVKKSIADSQKHRLAVASRIWTTVCCLIGVAMFFMSGTIQNLPMLALQCVAGMLRFVESYMLGLDMSQIPLYYFALPLLVTIVAAVAAIQKELREFI